MVRAADKADREARGRSKDAERLACLRAWGATPVAVYNRVQRQFKPCSYVYPEQMDSWSDAEILAIPGMGPKGLAAIRDAAAEGPPGVIEA